MFKSFVRKVGLTCLAGVVVLSTEAQGAATVSLKAVKKNGIDIVGGPTNTLSIAPNDTITVDLFYSGWGTPPFDGGSGLVQTYQAALLGATGVSSNGADPNNTSRLVLPVGWVAPVTKDSCPCENPSYPTCDPLYGCVGAGHAPVNMGTISNVRPDYIFFGFDTVRAVAVDSLDIKWASTIQENNGQTASRCQGGTDPGAPCVTVAQCPGTGASCNANFQSYAGTLNLKAGSGACGTYTFTLSANVALTFIANPAAIPVYALPAIQGLTLNTGLTCPPASGACCNQSTGVCTNNVLQTSCTGLFGGAGSTCANLVCVATTGACCNEATGVCTDGVTQANCTGRYGGNGSTCANISPPCIIPSNTIIAVSPTHCLIDARIPYLPGQPAQRRGFTSMTLTFQNPLGTGEDAPADFQVTQVPATTPPPLPTISNVTPGPGNTLAINFNVPINPNRWTCVRHIASNSRRCIGFLPADVSGNLFAGPADILTLVDHLNGVITPLPLTQCDMDRLGTCAPADILTLIDLLNGANSYPNQTGRTLEACPSTTP